MNYGEALAKIKSLEKFGLKPGLSRVKKLLEMMGSPQESLKVIHVAGTNGKGSVCFMLESILRHCGYKTGLYTSPSIVDYRERIRINGEMISKPDFCDLLEFTESFASNFQSDFLTEFEVTTAMALKYFYDQKCDFVILETGMGGRLDATNVVSSPLCSVVTTISLDHTNFLGDSIRQIAAEKLGIVKPNSVLVLGSGLPEEVREIAENTCKNLDTKLVIPNENLIKNFKTKDFFKTTFDYNGEKMQLGLIGSHQRYNVAIVLAVMDIIAKNHKIMPEKLKLGLKNVKIPCRLEVLRRSPLVILDASHNTESVAALARFIDENLQDKNLTAVVGMFADKDVDGVFKIIGKYFDRIILVKSENPRAMPLKDIKKIAEKYNQNSESCKNIADGIKKAFVGLGKNDGLIIFGSFSIMNFSKKIILTP